MTKLMEEKIYKGMQDIKQELKMIKSYIFLDLPTDHNEMSEDEALEEFKEGEKEYREGKTETLQKFFAREHPNLLKIFNAELKKNLKIQKESK